MILSSQFITAQFDFDPDGNVQIANSTSNVIRVQVGFNDGTDCVLDVWKTVCVAPWSSSIVGVPGKFPFTARAWTAVK